MFIHPSIHPSTLHVNVHLLSLCLPCIHLYPSISHLLLFVCHLFLSTVMRTHSTYVVLPSCMSVWARLDVSGSHYQQQWYSWLLMHASPSLCYSWRERQPTPSICHAVGEAFEKLACILSKCREESDFIARQPLGVSFIWLLAINGAWFGRPRKIGERRRVHPERPP